MTRAVEHKNIEPVLTQLHALLATSTPTAIALIAPTAMGKSQIVNALAQDFFSRGAPLPFEVISLDSALIYRELNIGAAKPSRHERSTIPHHLIDLRDPHETYNVATYCADCVAAIQSCFARQRHVLLVGGALMYFRALTQGLSALPPANESIRAQLNEDAKKIGWPALHARLREIDPETADKLAVNDQQRIERALEIWQISGVPVSSLIGEKSKAPKFSSSESFSLEGATSALPQPNPVNHILITTASATNALPTNPSATSIPLWSITLLPRNRARLHDTIKQRFLAMIDAGLIAEVQRLRQSPKLNPDLPAMRAVGYRQTWHYLDALASIGETHPPSTVASNKLFQDYLDRACAATRQLAKRQMTWLRHLPVDFSFEI